MKLHQEDPRLTAYLLGELPPEEAAAIERAVREDPSLRHALDKTEEIRASLAGIFGSEKDSLLPRHRERIRRAAKEAGRDGTIIPLKSHKKKNPWTIPMAIAAIITVGLFVLTFVPSAKDEKGAKLVTTKSGESESENANESLMGVIKPKTKDDGVIRLPLEAGRKSLSQISRAVRVERRAPTQDEVRIEEILNAFPLRAKDSVGLYGGASLGVEILSCPWKPSGCLVMVDIQGAENSEKEMTVEFRPDKASVVTHRLLGWRGKGKNLSSNDSSTIPKSGNVFLIIEIEARSAELGEISWKVNGMDAPAVQLSRDAEKEPSDDGRFAALIASFGLWLRGEEAPMIDDSLVLGLAREVAADGMVADRYDFLELVDQAVKLKER